MKDTRPIATVRRNSELRGARTTLPLGTSLVLAAACALVGFYAGDRNGFVRGGVEARRSEDRDPLNAIDKSAREHERVKERLVKEQPPPEAPAPSLTFQDTLKGPPRPPLPSPVPPPPAPPPKSHAEVKPAPAPAEEPPRVLDVPKPVKAEPAKPVEAAEAPAVPPATMKLAPATGELALQAGPFTQRAEVQALFEKLKAAGMKPAIVPLEQNGTTSYRIRLGRFPDAATAHTAAKALQEKQGVSAAVVKH